MIPRPEKVRPHHLDRVACIYVRQSTLAQVRHHRESTERQYGFVQRAEALGWPQNRVAIIDEDLGKSGTSAEGRGGFQRLVAEVCLGQIGAVFGLEISRLARSCADWYRLLELCGVARTLIVDDDGIYDPTDFNDRLLLGLKGTVSEIELHYLHQRLWGGKLHKARKGELALALPVGFVYDAAGVMRLHPDEQVQQSFRLLFDQFARLPSAHAVLRFFRDQGLQFPSRRESGRSASQILWRPLSYGRVLSVLHNPFYAGAYFFGRRSERLAPPERRSISRPMAEWDVLLWEHHPGYIDRETFAMNQQKLAGNQTNGPWVATRGAVREGAALLQGLALCGRCGRRMSIRYPGRARGQGLYLCDADRTRHAGRTCQSVLSPPIDGAAPFWPPCGPPSCASPSARSRPSRRSGAGWPSSGSARSSAPSTRPSGRTASSTRSSRRTAWWRAPWRPSGTPSSRPRSAAGRRPSASSRRTPLLSPPTIGTASPASPRTCRGSGRIPAPRPRTGNSSFAPSSPTSP